jgi:hypothetical protein
MRSMLMRVLAFNRAHRKAASQRVQAIEQFFD